MEECATVYSNSKNPHPKRNIGNGEQAQLAFQYLLVPILFNFLFFVYFSYFVLYFFFYTSQGFCFVTIFDYFFLTSFCFNLFTNFLSIFFSIFSFLFFLNFFPFLVTHLLVSVLLKNNLCLFLFCRFPLF